MSLSSATSISCEAGGFGIQYSTGVGRRRRPAALPPTRAVPWRRGLVAKLTRRTADARIQSAGFPETGERILFTTWGCSLAGRAPPLHGGGQGFESPQLHQVYVYLQKFAG